MEKIKSLAWYWQLVILLVVAGLVYGSVYYFYTSGIRTETAGIVEQADSLRAKNTQAQIATQRINEFRSLFAAKTEEYDELKVLLPEQREITNILQGLNDTAQGSRLILRRFSPKDDVLKDSIMEKPVEVEVDSNFVNLKDFFEKMGKLQRIVSISDFSINQLDDQSSDRTIHSQFLLSAYYAAPEGATPPPGKPGQPTPPGATPPAANPAANTAAPAANTAAPAANTAAPK